MNSKTMNSSRVLFLGRSTFDLLYRLDELPAEDTKVYARNFLAAPGGPALNAAITHSMLGGQSMLISSVGAGPWAAAVRAELDRHRIALFDLAAGTAYETPVTTVLVNAGTGSRTIVNPPISTGPAQDLQALPVDWLPLPSVLLTDGFHLAETLAFLTECKAAGAKLCLDGGSWKPGTAELAPLLTAAICSERFTLPGQPSDPESLFAWYAALGVPHIALTRGARPILASDHGRRFEIEVTPIDVADTLGAGDVLHGAFVHYLAQGHSFESALRKAAEVATLSCKSLGTQAWAGISL